MKKKAYQAPQTKVVEVQQTEIICGSTGSFTVSNPNVTKGEDSDWADENLNW